MVIEKITQEKYKEFLEKSELRYEMLQAPNFVKLKEGFILAGYDNNHNITHTIIIETRKAMRLWKYAYSGASELSISKDLSTHTDFLNSVSKWLKHKGYILWQIESSVEDRKYDAEGHPVIDSPFQQKYIDMMKESGFEWVDLGAGYNMNHQMTWRSVIDFEGRSAEEIYSTYSSTKRNTIRKSKKDGNTPIIRKPSEMSEINWVELYNMMEKSSEYQHFEVPTLEHIKEFAKCLGDEHVEIITVYNPENEPMYSGMFITTSDIMLYYQSGMDRKYSKANASILAQATMIERAINKGLSRFSFGGISGYFEKGQEGYGVFKQKKELGATVAHTFGVFNKPLTKVGEKFKERLV